MAGVYDFLLYVTYTSGFFYVERVYIPRTYPLEACIDVYLYSKLYITTTPSFRCICVVMYMMYTLYIVYTPLCTDVYDRPAAQALGGSVPGTWAAHPERGNGSEDALEECKSTMCMKPLKMTYPVPYTHSTSPQKWSD